MSLVPETAFEPGLLEPKTLLQRQIGAASPLWVLYAGAALTGATWWWLSRWGRPENLEAAFGAREVAPPAETPSLLALPEPLADLVEAAPEAAMIPSEVASTLDDPAASVAESVEIIVEAMEAAPAIMAQAAESAIEASVEATEAVVLAVAEAMDGPLEDPVGGESAPIAPTVAIAPRPRRKPIEPTTD